MRNLSIFALVAAWLAPACAFQNVPIELPKVVTTGLRGGEGRRLAVAIPFADERSDPRSCGIQMNTYGMETAKAICSEDPGTWIAGLLAQELRSAGFTVLSDLEPRPPSAVRIRGTLIRFFVEPVIGVWEGRLESDLHVKLVLRSASGLHAERSFYIKGIEKPILGTHGKFQDAVDQTVDHALRDMVGAILSLMNRFPELGEQRMRTPGRSKGA